MLALSVTPVVLADDDSAGIGSQLVIDEKTQTTSGLQTTVLEASHFGTELSVTGKAISLQPLLGLRNRYLALLSAHNHALIQLKHAEQNKQRQEHLYRQGVSSRRNLQEQQLQWQTDKAQVDAADLQTKAIIDEARLAWGGTLTAWSLTRDASKLAGFLSGQVVLLQITLPVDKPLPQGEVIYVEASGHRDKATRAQFISETAQTDSTLPGRSYFFQSSGRAIKPSMRVVAWIAEKKQAMSGVMIPKSAVIWLLDQLFVYIKTDKDKFSRRRVSDYTVAPDGYFAATGFDAGEEIVTTGAQMLLSEEQRRQIPDEDD
jgi:hypothetical protein